MYVRVDDNKCRFCSVVPDPEGLAEHNNLERPSSDPSDPSENILAQDKALYRGHAVAAVAAVNPHVAEIAIGLIEVEYEVLSPVINVTQAMKDDAPLVIEDLTTTELGERTDKRSNIASHFRYEMGDLEKGFAEADVVVERAFQTSTVHQGYIEPQNAAALWNADGKLTVWTSTQGAFAVRDSLAQILDLPVSQIRCQSELIRALDTFAGRGCVASDRFYWQLKAYITSAFQLTVFKARIRATRRRPMARVPFATRENMDAAGQAVWDDITSSRGGVQRNYAALLNNAQAAGAFAGLGGYVRFETDLNPRVKALAILTAARQAGGHYVWTVNQRGAKEANLGDDVIAAIREFRAPVGLEPSDAAVVQFVLELLRQHRISDDTFEGLRSQVGDAGIIDVLIIVAYYHGLAHSLQALEVELPDGVESDLTY
ncbi:Caffeine dehydrogenase subunit alpha [Geodia barretti]|uniref:Caffeine dehydrogenase subunit alpha n=1 Tax=Geodia barretti TaxID=519541 RepID=A0AA35R567_GEOBA|nr:Caffeine dehydrogenase subunit alpha [Geodia barretti]